MWMTPQTDSKNRSTVLRDLEDGKLEDTDLEGSDEEEGSQAGTKPTAPMENTFVLIEDPDTIGQSVVVPIIKSFSASLGVRTIFKAKSRSDTGK